MEERQPFRCSAKPKIPTRQAKIKMVIDCYNKILFSLVISSASLSANAD